VVLGDGEHHNAADPTLDFLGNRGRIYSLRLHPHAEANKKATHFAAGGAGRKPAWLFPTRRMRAALASLRWPLAMALQWLGRMSAFGGKADIPSTDLNVRY
jgi:hypothetical protein